MSMRPVGYFVHHQGRGHAERCAAIVNALPEARPVTIFCARDDILPALRPNVRVCTIPSLFERQGDEGGAMDHIPTPDTLHCAPLGWPGIRKAMAVMAGWFDRADPALMICDVSAEVAQMARLCSVPHVAILQHGDRDDPGHIAAFRGAAGLIAPCDAALAQDDWPDWMRAKTHFAPGLGIDARMPDRDAARRRLNLDADARVAVVVSGAGGEGVAQAPLGVAARTFPDMRFLTVGAIRRDWHATEPANLIHHGWVENAADFIAAADVVIASTGNTTCQQILSAGRPWLAVPEWRYFDEQVRKAECLDRAGVAVMRPHLPSSAQAWTAALAEVAARHDPARQAAMVVPDAERQTAAWLEGLIAALWPDETQSGAQNGARSGARNQVQNHAPDACRTLSAPEPAMPHARPRTVSALTIARGRADHLRNLIRGLTLQTQPPVDLLIGVMAPEPFSDLPDAPFPVRQILIPGDALPLARARNTVAREGLGAVLAFIDVDCIPDPALIAGYARACAPGAGLMMGEVLYLPGGATDDGLDFARFAQRGVRHSDRAGPPAQPVERCTDYRCFWSLNFAIHADDFARSGGFDEGYEGYGGEDTDFGRTLDSLDIPISWIQGARVYHQYHPHFMPPVHHLGSVVRNAERFRRKWGHRTMEHWLYCFGLMGLIENAPEGLRILGAPTEADLALCRQPPDQPYASTRRVIDILNDRAGQTAASAAERRRAVDRAQKSMLLPAAE